MKSEFTLKSRKTRTFSISSSKLATSRIALGALVSLAGVVIIGAASVSALSEANREKFAQNDIVFYDPDGAESGTPPSGQSNPCVSGGSGSGVAFSGSTGEEKLWSGLTSFLTDEQAAGVMGNMWNESHLNPAAHGRNSGYYAGFDYINDDGKNHTPKVDYGIGITQWSGGRRTNFLQCWILNIASCNNKYQRPEDYSDLIDIFNNYSRYGSHSTGINTIFERAAEDGISDKMDRLLAAELEYLRREINKTYSGLLNQTTVDGATDWFRINYEKNAGGDSGRKARAQEYYNRFHGTTSGGQTTPSEDGSQTPTDTCQTGDSFTITSGETGGQIAEAASKMSWPVQSGQSDDTHAGQCQTSSGEWITWNDTNKGQCKDNPRPTYKTAKTQYNVGGILQDCSRFVTTVLYAANLDEGTLPKGGSASTVTNWLASSSNWVELENTGKSMNLQPGDIFTNSQHVSIYIGDYGGSYGSNAAASWQDWVGRITKYTSSSSAILDGKWSSQGETKLPFRIFRYNAGTTGSGEEGGSEGGQEGSEQGGQQGGQEGGSENEEGGGTGTPQGGTQTSGDCSSGCGLQSPSSLVSQQSYSYNWKTSNQTDIANSGCSLIAVVNAAIALGRSVNIQSVANWSYSTKKISSAGWSTSVLPIASHLGLNTSGELYSSENTSYQTKLTAIKNALASGKMVIASGGGKNSGRASFTCSTSQAASGLCVFSPGGHFITIVGITADNKLIIGNPAKGSKSGQNWTYPAENVLKYSNKAIAVN